MHVIYLTYLFWITCINRLAMPSADAKFKCLGEPKTDHRVHYHGRLIRVPSSLCIQTLH